MTTRACSNCEYWHGRRDVPDALGECRVESPRVAAVIAMQNPVTRQPEPKAMTCFPNIAGTAWCGKFSELGPAFVGMKQ
ncbi:MAG TPA: hypothetical protein VF077_09025 [Nitrospiraceae bacterium]